MESCQLIRKFNSQECRYFYQKKSIGNENKEKRFTNETKTNTNFNCSCSNNTLIIQVEDIFNPNLKFQELIPGEGFEISINCNCNIPFHYFSISCRWFPSTHTLCCIGEWDLSGYDEITDDETALNMYKVKYNEILQFVNKVCRPLPRNKSPVYNLLNTTKIPNGLISTVMNYVHS